MISSLLIVPLSFSLSSTGRPVRASTVAATKASLALCIPYGRVKNAATPKRNFAQNDPIEMNATVDNVLAMRKRQRHARKPRQPKGKMSLLRDDQTIKNYFHVQSKSNVATEHAYNTFAPMHPGDSDPDADEEGGESDDAMQQFNGFDFQNQANMSVTSPSAVKRSSLNASGSLSTDFDDDDEDDDGSGSNRSSTSRNSIQQTNIFLQKPVLHLNIDKSLNQASSIVINKHLDVLPNFALNFAAFNNSITALNNNNNNQAMADERKRKSVSQHIQARLKRAKRITKRASGSVDNGLIDALNHSDSNSCDSGVVVDKTFEAIAANAIKPTTPHRIVCPSTSPVKHFKDPQQSTNHNQAPNLTSTPKAGGKSSKRQ